MKSKILSARALTKNQIQIELAHANSQLQREDIRVDGNITILSFTAKNNRLLLKTSDLNLQQNYTLEINGYGQIPLDLGPLLDACSTEKPLGFSVKNNQTTFRLFAPRAQAVKLVLFDRHTESTGEEFDMTRFDDGTWETTLQGAQWGKYYGYKISGPLDDTEKFQPDQVIADPYSRAVVTQNSYRHPAKSIVINTREYDWEGDQPLSMNWEDLIIYELHVRDLTVHPSAKVKQKGTYRGLVEKGAVGGIEHILELGVNAVELLPVQEFGNMEIPFGMEYEGEVNTWNPYARNHWGYMTSYFFAPESYYASGGNMQPGAYNGIRGQQVNEFKDMVKAFHREGIAVIMDVVYNHVSQYDWNPFKYIDKKYYFRLDPFMNFIKKSGCGNDFKTERPMARRMILESIQYWMEEYHIDGFRFDLATMIDWETIEKITEVARAINPHVILIAEPWGGGGYDLGGFSERGWGAWNDLIRNGVKGQNPFDGLGWIFGNYWGGNSLETMKRYVRGSTKKYGGPFIKTSHSINYLESHDDHTLGDFIRIGSGAVQADEKITDLDVHTKLTEDQMKLHKLSAVFLFTSQGAVMIGEGQEFARSKVVAKTDAPDPQFGHIDHNSYNKDNETNWLNFEHKKLNHELFEYYQGLIKLRKSHPAFRKTPSSKIRFFESHTEFSLGYFLPKKPSGDQRNFVVLMNANPHASARFKLPEGKWRRVVDGQRSGNTEFGQPEQGELNVPPQTSLVLVN
ncbi:MAG: pullulanase [bacterium]